MMRANYDKFPSVGADGACAVGWDDVLKTLRARQARAVAAECYPGVRDAELLPALTDGLKPGLVVNTADCMKPAREIDRMVEADVTDDPVFGRLTRLNMIDFFDAEKAASARRAVAAALRSPSSGPVLVYGPGASLISDAGLLVYADMPRWEIQRRFRRHEAGNLGADNRELPASLLYKRAFFVDWRVCDRLKRALMKRWDFVLDTTAADGPKLAAGDAVRAALAAAVTRPFRVAPFFDPAPWGGTWMREVCDLDRSVPNFGWCFDCVPEENSLLLKFGNTTMELPSINLVFQQPQELLGPAVYGRFGDEFPIRFDFLDTMGGGNLSFQVHPLTEYIRRRFGVSYTQDESYYLLDAGPDAGVYLGLREGIDREAMARDLAAAQAGGPAFDADHYANRWPARKHDHFLIPAGTVHCSGANALVLEISATPYIFTFKMWDWGRLGLDGKPRPIHLEHGLANVRWDRTTAWVRRELVNRVGPVAAGDGWVEERTGLHEAEFIETRRHWFTKPAPHHTDGGVNVLNLVEGREAVVENPDGAFEPFVIHYAETFIVPAAVGAYTVRPHGESEGKRCGTIKAFVRA